MMTACPNRLLAALLLAASPALGQGPGLSTLPRSDGWLLTGAAAVSHDGTAVVGIALTGPASDPQAQRAARWVLADGAWQPQDLGFVPGSSFTRAAGVSADGSTVLIRSGTFPASPAARWADPGPLAPLPGPAGWVDVRTQGLSPDGAFIVGSARLPGAGPTTPFTWVGTAAPQGLAMPAGASASTAAAVDGAGSIWGLALGLGAGGNERHLVRWTASGPQLPGNSPLPGAALVSSVSHDGTTVIGQVPGGAAQPTGQPWLWSEDAGLSLLPLPAGATEAAALAISADGSLIAGVSYAGGTSPLDGVATLWVGGSPVTLGSYLQAAGIGTDGWTFLYASGISGDGSVIVGDAVAPDGMVHGFVAVVPAPGSAAAAVLGAGTALLRRRRRC